MFHTRHHRLTPTQNSPTIYLNYHHWQKLARGGEQCMGSSTANTYKPKKQWGRIHWQCGLLSEPMSRPRNLFSVCCIAGKKKKLLKSELHEFFPGFVRSGGLWDHQFIVIWSFVHGCQYMRDAEQKPYKAIGRKGRWDAGGDTSLQFKSLHSFPTLGLTGTGSCTRRSPNTPPPAPPLA